MSADVVDATVVDEPATQPQEPIEPRGALVPVATQGEVMRPLDPEQLVESFTEYQALRGKLLTQDDYQSAGRGKSFVKKSGWRKIATAFGLNLELVRSHVERDEDGQPTRAEVWARAIAPNGRFADGDGYCDVTEDRFSGPRGNKSKLENDLRGTAATRATNRAISNLVGMGEVSAEEVGSGDQHADPLNEPASSQLRKQAFDALTYLMDNDPDVATKAAATIKDALSRPMPGAAAMALVVAAATLRDSRPEGPSE